MNYIITIRSATTQITKLIESSDFKRVKFYAIELLLQCRDALRDGNPILTIKFTHDNRRHTIASYIDHRGIICY